MAREKSSPSRTNTQDAQSDRSPTSNTSNDIFLTFRYHFNLPYKHGCRLAETASCLTQIKAVVPSMHTGLDLTSCCKIFKTIEEQIKLKVVQ